MKLFNVGSSYEAYQREFGSITVLRRTCRTVYVRNNSGVEWRMYIRTDAAGNEYVIDTSVPKKWRDAFTYFA